MGPWSFAQVHPPACQRKLDNAVFSFAASCCVAAHTARGSLPNDSAVPCRRASVPWLCHARRCAEGGRRSTARSRSALRESVTDRVSGGAWGVRGAAGFIRRFHWGTVL
jgi:hypothetical protein